MKKTGRFIGTLIAALLIVATCQSEPSRATEANAPGDEEAHRIRRRIETMYGSWDRGLFGSRRYYRRELESFLVKSIGKNIATRFDYPLVFPELLSQRRFTIRFKYADWLEVRGEVSEEDFKALLEGAEPGPSQWWRMPVLVSLEGKIKRFRLEDGPPRRVVVVLEGLRPVRSKSTGKAAP